MSRKTFALLAALAAAQLPGAALAANKTWSGNFPTAGSVTIPAGDVVTLDTDVTLTDLTVNGQLICADRDLALSAAWIMVHGLLQCGTPAAPYTRRLDVTLTGNNPNLDVMGMGTKFLGAMAGGRIVLTGENRKGWTRLAATANRGAGQITLKEALPWRVGDRIVIASTDFRAENAEERTITAVNGTRLTLDAPLARQHWCATTTYNAMSLEECAEVGLLTRNIRIQGDSYSTADGFGGHMMIMGGSSAKLSGIELYRMGQKGRLARYPMHWHLVGDAPGQYLNNSSIVHAYNRFLSVHGTHFVRLAGNVGFDTIGHGFYLEDAIERGNVIEDNLGILVKNASDGLPTASDRQAATFWISNPDNAVRRNVAAGSQHTGFWLGFPEHPIGLSARTDVWPRRTPLREFADNVSHSNGTRGLFIDGAEDASRNTVTTWFEPRQTPSDVNSPVVPPVFRNFTAYKNRSEGIWMRGFSKPVIQGARLADNWMGAYFASISGTPGYIQDSLVVGETANKGNPESWEAKGLDGRELPRFWSPQDSIRGLQFYDGPMVIRRTVFANFTSNSQRKAGAVTNLSPNPFWISSGNGASALSFLNSNRVWLDPLTPGNNGDGFSIIRDVDGSITGTAGRRIVPPNPVLLTASCTARPDWNASICPHNYVGVEIFTDGTDISNTLLTRDDGAQASLSSAPNYPGNLHFMAIENRRYSLTLPGPVPDRISFTRYEQAGKAARLALPYPTAAFTVTLWGWPVANAASLAELASGGTKYFYDAAAKRLHLRLVSDDGGWKEYEVNK